MLLQVFLIQLRIYLFNMVSMNRDIVMRVSNHYGVEVMVSEVLLIRDVRAVRREFRIHFNSLII